MDNRYTPAYPPTMDRKQTLRDKAAQFPQLPGCTYTRTSTGTVLYVGKAEPAQPGPQLLQRGPAGRRQDRHADPRSPRHRLHPGRQREGSAGARKQPHQAVQAALQHPAARRQDLSRTSSSPPRSIPRVYVTRRLRRTAPPTTARISRAISRTGWCTSSTGTSRCRRARSISSRKHTHPACEYHIHRCLGPCVDGLIDRRSNTPKRSATCGCSSKAGTGNWRDEPASAHGEPPPRRCASRKPAALRDLISHSRGDGAEAEDGRRRRRRHRHLRLLRRAAAGRGESVPPAQRPGSSTAASSSGKISSSSTRPSSSRRCSSRSIWISSTSRRMIHVPVDFEDREDARRSLSEKRGRKVEIHTPQRGQKKAMLALVETNAKHSFDAAVPRDEAVVARRSRRRCRTRSACRNAPRPHRVLRHLAHPGHRQGREHGGVGRRPDEEIRLPQVHHPDRGGQRRFRLACAK